MKKLKNDQSRRIVVFVQTVTEKTNALKLIKNDPSLFIWKEEGNEFNKCLDQLKQYVKGDMVLAIFARRGVHYTYRTILSENSSLEILN